MSFDLPGTQEHGLHEVRLYRESLLIKSDWTQGADSPLSDSKKAEWATYRQALRDITSDLIVPFTDKGIIDWDAINWPTKPE